MADYAESLARKLAAHLETPTEVGAQAVRFAETALGLTDAAGWRELLADADDPDRAMLVELLLFPGRSLRLELEPMLSEGGRSVDAQAGGAVGGGDARGVSPVNASELAESVARSLAGHAARFVLSDGLAVDIRLGRDDAALLVRRLRLENTPPGEILDALEALGQDERIRGCVRLRMARFPWTPAARFMIGALVGKLGADADFPVLLDWCCLFLEAEDAPCDPGVGSGVEGAGGKSSGPEEMMPGEASVAVPEVDDGLVPGGLPGLAGMPSLPTVTPPEFERLSLALAARHALAVRLLKDHAARQERWDKSNFETMLMSGDRPPHGDPESLRGDMAAADRIRMAVFGLSAASSVLDRDLGEVGDGDALSGMLRLMD